MADWIEFGNPPWLVAMLDQRMALLRDQFTPELIHNAIEARAAVVTPLTEPAGLITPEIWEETCDRCSGHFPGQLYVGKSVRFWKKIRFEIFFGVCESCKEEKPDAGHFGRGAEQG